MEKRGPRRDTENSRDGKRTYPLSFHSLQQIMPATLCMKRMKECVETGESF